jgi:hypothetical protein
MVTTTSEAVTAAVVSSVGVGAVEVDADLGHGGADGGVDRVGRSRSGGAHLDPPCRMVLEEGGGHLGAAWVVDRCLPGTPSTSTGGGRVDR